MAPTILIAEDNDDVRAVLQRIFTRAGFTVLTVPDGRAALGVAQEQHPDMVLTDLDMPHLDGLALCRAIRHHPTLHTTPVAVLSGGLQPGDARTAGAHVCRVLLKPFATADLVTAVRYLITMGKHDHDHADAGVC